MSAVESIPTPTSIPNELNYAEPISAIPPGFRQVNFRQVNYNTIPQPTPGGSEIQINIPQIPNAFVDTGSTYLNVKVRISGNYRSPAVKIKSFSATSTWWQFGNATTPEYARYCISKGIHAGHLNANAWGVFSRYQLYANNSILIEDIDEIGYLQHMLNSVTRSVSTFTAADAHGDSPDGIYPGHRFVLIHNMVVRQLRNSVLTTTAIPTANDGTVSNRAGEDPWYRGVITSRNFPYKGWNRKSRGTVPDNDFSSYSADGTYGLDTNYNSCQICSTAATTASTTLTLTGIDRQNAILKSRDFARAVVNGRGFPGASLYGGTTAAGTSTTSADGNSYSNVVRYFTPTGDYAPAISDYELVSDLRGGHTWSIDYIGENLDSSKSDRNAPSSLTPWSHDYEFCLPLIGILGANNDKLYPMMYPTQIRLITEQIANILNLPPTFENVTLSITSLEFCCNYLKLDSGAMGSVLSSLPIPGVIPMRCTSYVHSSVQLNKGSQGAYQVLVSSRRASVKALFMGFSSIGSSLASSYKTLVIDDVTDAVLPTSSTVIYTEGDKFNSINPSLGQNTYLNINGIFYPQQMLNPLLKPSDCYNQFIQTLNMTQSSIMRPSVKLYNYLRCDWGSKYSSSDPNNSSLTQWNLPATLTRRGQLNFTSIPKCVIAGVSTTSGTRSAFTGENEEMSGIVDLFCSEISSDLAGADQAIIGRNQFYLAIDTEHFGKRGFLSGVSTLGGSCFMNLNIVQPLATDYIVRMYNYHDVMLAFNMQTGQVEVKI